MGSKSVFGITTFTVDAQYYPAFALPLLLITISTALVANSIFASRDARPLKNEVIKTSFILTGGIRTFNQLKVWWKARALRPALIRHHGTYADITLNDVEMAEELGNESDIPAQGLTSTPGPITFGMSPAHGLVGSSIYGLVGSSETLLQHREQVERTEQKPPTKIASQPPETTYDPSPRTWSWEDGDDAIGAISAHKVISNRTSGTVYESAVARKPTPLHGDATPGRRQIPAYPPMDHTPLETILEQSPPLARNGPSGNLAHFGDDD
jgi:hypothetical protein